MRTGSPVVLPVAASIERHRLVARLFPTANAIRLSSCEAEGEKAEAGAQGDWLRVAGYNMGF